ncbi:uncharacterized protein TNCV_2187841 [Trichonephila clavipes]|nr:uncharacterized protein TNCV_2187841 [Trichonephila clavipes]
MSNKVIILYGAVDADCLPICQQGNIDSLCIICKDERLVLSPKGHQICSQNNYSFPPFNQLTVSTHTQTNLASESSVEALNIELLPSNKYVNISLSNMYRVSTAVKGLPPHRRLGQRAAAITRDATLHADGRDRLATAADVAHRGRRTMAYTPLASPIEGSYLLIHDFKVK